MLTRQKPWPGLTPLQVAVAVALGGERVSPPPGDDACPPPLRALIAACMLADPKARPSAAEVAKRLAIIAKQSTKQRSSIAEGS